MDPAIYLTNEFVVNQRLIFSATKKAANRYIASLKSIPISKKIAALNPFLY